MRFKLYNLLVFKFALLLLVPRGQLSEFMKSHPCGRSLISQVGKTTPAVNNIPAASEKVYDVFLSMSQYFAA